MSDEPILDVADELTPIDNLYDANGRLRAENALLRVRIAELEDELKRRREQIGQAFDAMDSRHLGSGPKKYTRYPCHCGAMISNSGHAAASHLRGSIHRQNLERKALGLPPV